MTKVRFSISVEPEEAARIKEAAARANQDVSAYMSQAALDAAERDARAAAIFADVDARIARAEAQDPGPWPPPPADGELSPDEQEAIRTRWEAFFTAANRGAA